VVGQPVVSLHYPAVADVDRRERQYHQEGWQDEGDAYSGGIEHGGTNVAEIDGELRGKRSRPKLGQRESST